MAVQLCSHNVDAKSSSDFPFFARYFLTHCSPASAWLNVPLMGPIECFEVINSFEGVRAAINIMQPLDFREAIYGAQVPDSNADH